MLCEQQMLVYQQNSKLTSINRNGKEWTGKLRSACIERDTMWYSKWELGENIHTCNWYGTNNWCVLEAVSWIVEEAHRRIGRSGCSCRVGRQFFRWAEVSQILRWITFGQSQAFEWWSMWNRFIDLDWRLCACFISGWRVTAAVSVWCNWSSQEQFSS